MLQSILVMGVAMGIFVSLFITPAIYAKGVKLIIGEELDATDKLKCWIPVYNVAKAEAMYTGRKSFILITFVATCVSAILSMLVGGTANELLIRGASFLLFVSLIGVYAAHVYSVFLVIYDTGVVNIVQNILLAVFYPIGQYYIGSFLPNVVKNVEKESDIFKW